MNHVIQCDLWRHRYSLLRHHFWSSTDTASPDVTTTVVPTTADVIKPDRKRRPVTPEVTLTDVFSKISLVFRSSNLRVILAQGPCSVQCFIFAALFGVFFCFNKAVNDRVEKVIWRSKCIKIAKKLVKKQTFWSLNDLELLIYRVYISYIHHKFILWQYPTCI